MDHVRFDAARIQPTRQPEAIAAGFEGQCNPRDLFTGPDRFIAPTMQQAKKPFRARFQLLLRLALNAGEHTGDQPARLAQLDDGNDCAIVVQGDEGPAQVVQLGHKGTPSVSYLQRRWCHLLRRLPHTISPGYRGRSTDCLIDSVGRGPDRRVRWLDWGMGRHCYRWKRTAAVGRTRPVA